MNTSESLKHTKWECKYHIVWIPKYRKKSLYKDLRQYMGDMLKDLASQKECKILEGHLMADHVHILISIPPKYSVSQVVGFIKGKSAISIARTYTGRRKNFTGPEFLGKRVLRFNSRQGRGNGKTLHQASRKRGQANRATRFILRHHHL
jgi:putative transposase